MRAVRSRSNVRKRQRVTAMLTGAVAPLPRAPGCRHRQAAAPTPVTRPLGPRRARARRHLTPLASRHLGAAITSAVIKLKLALLLLARRRREMAAAGAAALRRLGVLLLPFLAVAACLDVPSHGCYWTGCQSKWFGVCAARHFLDSQSDDCDGLCMESKSPPCLPLHTHFYCCKPGIPKVTNKCGHCKSKLDFGKEFICCTDCSDPTIMDKNTKLGYCKSGADLTMQLKPQETFHWVAGPWMICSSPCDGGVRYRDVACYGSLDDSTIKHYPVDDASCSADEMPARQEACNQQSCSDPEMTQSMNPKRSGMSGWLVAMVVVLGLGALGGIAFISYTYYRRRTSGPSGFVYVMMEAYS